MNVGIEITDAAGRSFSDNSLTTRVIKAKVINTTTSVAFNLVEGGEYWAAFHGFDSSIIKQSVSLDLQSGIVFVENPSNLEGLVTVGVY